MPSSSTGTVVRAGRQPARRSMPARARSATHGGTQRVHSGNLADFAALASDRFAPEAALQLPKCDRPLRSASPAKPPRPGWTPKRSDRPHSGSRNAQAVFGQANQPSRQNIRSCDRPAPERNALSCHRGLRQRVCVGKPQRSTVSTSPAATSREHSSRSFITRRRLARRLTRAVPTGGTPISTNLMRALE